MSSEIETPSSQAEGMQFDHAEFENSDAPAVACTACNRAIEGQYFEINHAVVCEPCRDAIEAQLKGGSGLARIVRATILGGGAAAISAVGYALFIRLTGLDWSLISVLVGFIVGTSVRKGSGGRGGSFYQAMAVLLTYLAVGLTHTSLALAGAGLPGDVWLQPAFLLGISELLFKIPVMHAQNSPISILIIGFALWEAWKLNKPLKLIVTGPYRVGEALARTAEAEAEAGADA
jgi:hypothetical protein